MSATERENHDMAVASMELAEHLREVVEDLAARLEMEEEKNLRLRRVVEELELRVMCLEDEELKAKRVLQSL